LQPAGTAVPTLSPPRAVSYDDPQEEPDLTDPVTRLTAALAGRYRIERELGQGGMATVYLAADLKHDRKVAIKVLKPELAAVLGAERFVQEIKTTAALSHPHILPLFDSGEAGGFLYYVMPYIQGETIREKLNRETQFGIDEAVRITTEVAEALDYAHRHGVIHRDMKPENILLHDGRAMVMDFGIALALSAAAGGRMTETGLSLGTPHYMSPEQATADKQITARSDVYSLASVCYEMLAGEPPHTGGSAQAIIMKIVTDTARPVTELRKSVPPHVAAALAKALEKVPADRFESAKAFAAALGNPTFTTAAGGVSVAATARAGSRARALIIGLSATTLIFAAVATWAMLRPEPPRPVSRYALTLPVDHPVFVGSLSQVASAPDGSWFVYSSPTSSGSTELWVKARDRLEPSVVAGGEGGRIPAVSPDGQWIAFTAAGELRKVAARGGSATTIAKDVGSGPVWLDNGTLAYSASGYRSIVRVAADGGEPEVMATMDSLRTAMPVAALPDAGGLLFHRCVGLCGGTSELWVLDSRSGKSKQLLPDAVWASYVHGSLIFARRDGTVFGAEFDLRRLAVKGAPVALLEGVVVTSLAQMAVATGSGTLVYLASAATSGESDAVWVSRDGRAVPVDSAWSFRMGPLDGWSLAPDGSRLAISIFGESSSSDVWVKELDRGQVSRLTFSGSQDLRPRWTPDGRGVTFVSDRGGNSDLYLRRADGTGTDSLLFASQLQVYESQLSRDGQWIVMRAGSNENGRDILALRVGQDTAPRTLLAGSYDEEALALSPDGRWLAYVSSETGRREVFVRPFPEVDSGKWQVSTTGGLSPVWAHSGRELFFLDGKGNLVSQAVQPGASFTRGGQRALFSMAGYREVGNYHSFDVAPDDQRFLMVRMRRGAETEAQVLVVVDNWIEEVKRRMRER